MNIRKIYWYFYFLSLGLIIVLHLFEIKHVYIDYMLFLLSGIFIGMFYEDFLRYVKAK